VGLAPDRKFQTEYARSFEYKKEDHADHDLSLI